MKIYKLEFQGVYLGGSCVVVAKNREFAERLISTRIKADPRIDFEGVDFSQIKEFGIDAFHLVHFDNGDY